MKIHKDIPGVEYWWDHYVRTWYAATVDSKGNLGPTVDAYTKREIIKLAKELEKTK
jgi:hypothetical protein